MKDYGILLLLELSKEIALKVLINRGQLYMELGDYANACEVQNPYLITGSTDFSVERQPLLMQRLAGQFLYSSETVCALFSFAQYLIPVWL